MWQTLRINEIENKLNTNLKDGLSKDEVEKRRKEYGENKLEGKKKMDVRSFLNGFDKKNLIGKV